MASVVRQNNERAKAQRKMKFEDTHVFHLVIAEILISAYAHNRRGVTTSSVCTNVYTLHNVAITVFHYMKR